jgi:hypothetical protein
MATTSPIWALPAPQLIDGPADIEQAVVPLRDRLETLLSGFATRPVPVAALPSSPADKQEILYQDANFEGQGIAWHLRYRGKRADGSNNPNTYKWEFIGGPGLHAPSVDPPALDETGWAVNTWDSFDTNDPLVGVPLKGVYSVHFGATMAVTGGSGVTSILTGLGTAFAQPSNGVQVAAASAFTDGRPVSMSARRIITVSTSPDALLRQWFMVNATGGTAVRLYRQSAFMHITPIMLG